MPAPGDHSIIAEPNDGDEAPHDGRAHNAVPTSAVLAIGSYTICLGSCRPRPWEFPEAGEPTSAVALFVVILGRARPRPRIPPRPRPRARSPGWTPSPPRSRPASTPCRSGPGPGSWSGIGRGSTPTRSSRARRRGYSGLRADRRPATSRAGRSPRRESRPTPGARRGAEHPGAGSGSPPAIRWHETATCSCDLCRRTSIRWKSTSWSILAGRSRSIRTLHMFGADDR